MAGHRRAAPKPLARSPASHRRGRGQRRARRPAAGTIAGSQWRRDHRVSCGGRAGTLEAVERQPRPVATPRPAASVVLLRDGAAGPEILYLRRSPDLKFMGGYWVFPGGRIDPGDHLRDGGSDELAPARQAAAREAHEEAGVTVDPAALHPICQWTTPATSPIRFATWFFAAAADPPEHSRRRRRDRGPSLVAAARRPAGAPRPAHPVREPDVRAQHPARRTRHRRRGARRRRHLAPGTPAWTHSTGRRRAGRPVRGRLRLRDGRPRLRRPAPPHLDARRRLALRAGIPAIRALVSCPAFGSALL